MGKDNKTVAAYQIATAAGTDKHPLVGTVGFYKGTRAAIKTWAHKIAGTQRTVTVTGVRVGLGDLQRDGKTIKWFAGELAGTETVVGSSTKHEDPSTEKASA